VCSYFYFVFVFTFLHQHEVLGGWGVGGEKLYILFSGANKPVQLHLRLTSMYTLNTPLYSQQNTSMSAAVSVPFLR